MFKFLNPNLIHLLICSIYETFIYPRNAHTNNLSLNSSKLQHIIVIIRQTYKTCKQQITVHQFIGNQFCTGIQTCIPAIFFSILIISDLRLGYHVFLLLLPDLNINHILVCINKWSVQSLKDNWNILAKEQNSKITTLSQLLHQSYSVTRIQLGVSHPNALYSFPPKY